MSTPIHLTGRLTRDPELRFSASGTAVVKFAVVTSRRVKDKQTGEWSDADTSFWDCVAFNQLAENVAESLQRGMAVVVSGRMAQRSFETREGEKRTVVEVTVDNVGPDLRFATAKVTKVQRQGGQSPRQGGRDLYGGQQPADPWATSQQGFDDNPPF